MRQENPLTHVSSIKQNMGTDNNRSPDDFLSSYLQYQKEHAQAVLSEHWDEIDSFIAFAKGRGVELSARNISYVEKIGIVASAPRLLERLSEGIERERSGLVPFGTFPLKLNFGLPYAGYFNAGNFAPMAHPHFRRGLHGECHFAPRFIELFWATSGAALDKYIALDEDRVMLDIFLGEAMEKATWFGAPFNQDISQVPNGIVKLKPPPDLNAHHASFLFADVHCLDVKWRQTGIIKGFQALEIKSENVRMSVDGETYYPARYLHAEFDLATGKFRHFDGAMQYLTELEYRQRIDSDFNYNAKNRVQIKPRYAKLFKLNGSLGTSLWSVLCCHFFADNPLMFEYFQGRYPPQVAETLARLASAQQGEA